MLRNIRKSIALIAATSMLFGSVSTVNAFEKSYNDPYSLAQEYLRFTGVTTVIGEKHTKTEKVKVAVYDGGFQLDHEDLQDIIFIV